MNRSRGARVAAAIALSLALVSAPASAAARTSAPLPAFVMTLPKPVVTTLTVRTSGARVGDPVCIEALLFADGFALRNRTIVFALQGIPVGSSTTGISGQANLCATASLHGGTYPEGIGAGFAGDGLFAPSTGSAELSIWPRETFVHTFPTEGPYLGTATFATQLTFSLVLGTIPNCIPSPPPNNQTCAIVVDVPLPGRTIHFFRVGVPVGSAVTDANGIAAMTVPLSGLNSFQYLEGITSVYAGEPDYAAGTLSNTLAVLPQSTSLAVAPGSGSAGGSTSLSALLRFGGGLPLADRLVVFYLNDVIVGTATTGSDGVATLENVSLSGIAPGGYASGVKALFLGELNFQPTAGSASLTVGPAAN